MEKEIITRLKGGDKLAFDQVFDNYYQLLCIYSFQFVQSAEIAEDIVQDVFVHIWENRLKINLEKSFKSYLYTIVKNRCLDHLKHLKIKDNYLKEKLISPNHNEKEIEFDRIENLYKAIDTLPPKCKEVFTLSRFENYKYAEIAERLCISIKTVENHMGKALKHLKNTLKAIE